ncbi:hypothetical protein D9V41_03740 [Aeromicrobium phragmitis]|uniref:PPM-type phosphatase domain-containing protein n=1 Tax=Aeromicrobium phragmitis TaxID=2478914 RepID=A0A3L8PSD9_9ACTN|nr:SpoIIE family protein phosphatase [Aeromicrobium phragmitis]RLV56892.1 hypothetical protein D9V41_03740 [Aeromicrobium phragmitis]
MNRDVFSAAGTIRSAYDEVDWDATPLGHPSTWSVTLRDTVDLMLHSKFAMTLLWGPEFVLVYNEAYVPVIGDKHPSALGRPAREAFPEAWDVIGPLMRQARETGVATHVIDQKLPLFRHGFLEDCYFSYSYSPVRGPSGEIEGVIDVMMETTREMAVSRRSELIVQLADALLPAQSREDAVRRAIEVLTRSDTDLASAVIGPLEATDAEPTNSRRLVMDLGAASGEERLALDVVLSPGLVVDDHTTAFVKVIADTIGRALDRVAAMEAERRAGELTRQLAETLQRSLLPEVTSPERFEMAVRYQAASEQAQIGGDWYDVFPLSDGSLAFAVGDVSGHDREAAAAMAQVRNLLRGISFTQPDSPGLVMQALDRALEGLGVGAVATALFARLDERPDGIEMRWSNAGHPAPILLCADGSAQLLETAPELMLGVDGASPRRDHVTPLAPGDAVVCYTDGLVERRDRGVHEGMNELLALLQGYTHLSSDALCDLIATFATDAEDDVAVLVLRAR